MKLFNAIAATTVIATSFVTAQAFAQMLGQDMGDQASILVDLKADKMIMKNDGDPSLYAADGTFANTHRGVPSAAYPVEGGIYGAEESASLDNDLRRKCSQLIYQNLQGREPAPHRY